MYYQLSKDVVDPTAAVSVSAGLPEDLPSQFLLNIGWGHDYVSTDGPSRYDAYTGSYFLDADKGWSGDTLLCWAAAASNQLAWTGWAAHAEGENFATEDQVFDYFRAYWSDEGGWSFAGYSWFFNGPEAAYDAIDSVNPDYASTAPESGGGFFATVDATPHLIPTDNISTSVVWGDESVGNFNRIDDYTAAYLDLLKAYFIAGYSINLNILIPGYDGAGHAITAWGYEEDADGNMYLYCSDSDNIQVPTDDPAANANVLTKYEIYYDASVGMLKTYENWYYLSYYSALASYDSNYIGVDEIMAEAKAIDGQTRIRYGRLDDDGRQRIDVDYYVINLNSDALISVNADIFSDDVGRGQFTLTVYDASGNVLAESDAASYHQALTVLGFGGEALYVKVAGTPGTGGTDNLGVVLKNVYTVSYGAGTWIYSDDGVTQDVTAPTIGNVTVTVDFGDAAIKRYSLDGGKNWIDYTGPITVDQNQRIYFYSNSTDIERAFYYEVTNIDHSAPDAPVVTLSPAEMTNQDVVMTVTFAADAATRQYSFDGATWLNYTAPLTITENGTVYFRFADALGNVDTSDFTVSNIDKVAPEKPVATADVTAPTNGKVTVSAVFPDDAALQQYSLDGGENWESYTGALVFEENQAILFRAIDAVGNVSEITELVVGNIDRLPPEKPVAAADVTEITNQPVRVTAAFADDACRKEYSLNGWIWHAYSDGVTLRQNGTVYFRCFDEAGNASGIEQFAVTNIDLVGPEKPEVFANVESTTSYNVKLAAAFAADAVRNQYSFDGRTWQAYTGPVVVTENGPVYFRSFDAAGNAGKSAVYTVDNIDATVSSGLVGIYSRFDRQTLEVALPGRYTLENIEFGNLNARLSVTDENGRRIASGTVRNGMLSFGEMLLDSGRYYLTVENTDGGASAGYYATRLAATAYFTLADQQLDDDWRTAPALSAAPGGSVADEWVGFGDAVDYRRLTLDSSGILELALSGNSNTLKMTVYEVAGDALRKVKSVTVKAGSAAGTGGLKLDDAKEYVLAVEAPKAAAGVNSAYTVTLSGILFDNRYNALDNNQWENAVALDLDNGIAGEYVGLGDARDWFRFELAGAGALDLALRPEVAKAAGMTLYVYDETRQGLRKLRSGSDWSDLDLAAGRYFVEVVSADQGKGKKNTEYGIAVDFEPAIERRSFGGTLA